MQELRDRLRQIDYIGLWPDALGLLLLILGLMGEIPGSIPYPPIPEWMIKLHRDMSNDMIAIGITVLIIDNANKWTTNRIATREEKKRLILQMGSPINSYAIEAVRQLRSRRWLSDGTLRRADLTEAYLFVADLTGANLRMAKLRYANLTGADLTEADLRGVKLTGAKGITDDQIKSVESLKGATMPDGSKYKPLDEQQS